MKNDLTTVNTNTTPEKKPYTGLPNLNSLNPAPSTTYTTPEKAKAPLLGAQSGFSSGYYAPTTPLFKPDQKIGTGGGANSDLTMGLANQGIVPYAATGKAIQSDHRLKKATTDAGIQNLAGTVTEKIEKSADATGAKKKELREEAAQAIKKADESGFDILGLLEAFGAGYLGRESKAIAMQEQKKANKRQDELIAKETEIKKQEEASAFQKQKELMSYEQSLRNQTNFAAQPNASLAAAQAMLGGK